MPKANKEEAYKGELSSTKLVEQCQKLLEAHKSGELGQTRIPEDSNPHKFENTELRLAYFTLPMALNYQRDSYKLWEAALKTYQDPETSWVFDITKVVGTKKENLAKALLKHKLGLQPNKHTETWQNISKTVESNFGSFSNLINISNRDFLKLKNLIQVQYKKGFPYLSGPKIFNYWSFIIQEYGGVKLHNSEFIEIAPDTHVVQCSLKLGVIKDPNLSREEINNQWRQVLTGSGITPIQMHSPLWFWSRNGFKFEIK
ncbi:Uncharacterised protein [uncultured archaeon]|nr:Uncharacterised protein [uncultured archaeon]